MSILTASCLPRGCAPRACCAEQRSGSPAVHWPGQNGGLFYLACQRV